MKADPRWSGSIEQVLTTLAKKAISIRNPRELITEDDPASREAATVFCAALENPGQARRYLEPLLARLQGKPQLMDPVACFITARIDPWWGLNLLAEECLQRGMLRPVNPYHKAVMKAAGKLDVLADVASRLFQRFPSLESDTLDRVQARRQEGFPSALLVTQPKSGGVFIANRFADLYGMPGFYISLKEFPEDHVVEAKAALFGQGGAWTYGHLNASPENLDRLARAGIKKILVHLRDPRQTTLSWAHYMEEGAVARHGRRLYERIVSSDITPVSMLDAPFAEKLDWYAEHIFPRFMEWILGWIRVRDTDRRFDVRVMEFRQLKEQPLAYMQEAAAFFGVPCEINRVAAPRQGVANFRAGQMDEWRQAFNPGQIDRMTRQIPETIAAEAGWELPR